MVRHALGRKKVTCGPVHRGFVQLRSLGLRLNFPYSSTLRPHKCQIKKKWSILIAVELALYCGYMLVNILVCSSQTSHWLNISTVPSIVVTQLLLFQIILGSHLNVLYKSKTIPRDMWSLYLGRGEVWVCEKQHRLGAKKKKKRKENQHQTAPALLSGSLLYLGIISTSTSSDSKEPVGLVIYKILKILILWPRWCG